MTNPLGHRGVVVAALTALLPACGGDDGVEQTTRAGAPSSSCDAAQCDGSAPSTSPEDGGAPPDATGDATRDGGAPEASTPVAACCDPFVVRLSRLEEQWPLLLPGQESRSFSSYDRTGGNSDGFTGAHSSLYRTDSGEYVLFDAYGPGVLDTLWFTGPEEGGAGLELGTVRFYLDDEASPRVAKPWRELFRGDVAPFVAPLVADNSVSTGGFVSFVPVPYARRLVVTTTERPAFYQAHYESLSPDAVVASFDPENDVELARARFESVLRAVPSTELVESPLDTTLEGAGVLEVLRFTPSAVPTDDELAAARLRITWDDAAEPAVDVPLGAFFGSGLGAADVRSLPLSIHDGAFESRFPMPFWARAHVVIEGLDGKLELRRAPQRYGAAEAGHFHATYAEEHPTTSGRHFAWLDVDGAGNLAGTLLTVRPTSPSTKKWWEGDLHSSIDGIRTPALEGTGHEDDHLGGWSNTWLDGPFTLPLHGLPRTDMLDRNGQYNANATMYRFYPGLRFGSHLRHAVEHGDRDGVSGNYSGVAYYYLAPGGSRLVETDTLDVTDETARTAHDYVAAGEGNAEPLTSRFDGPWNDGDLTRNVARHTGAATFRLAAISDNTGCQLRRLFDQDEGRQGARVTVDGAPVGIFYAAEQNRTRRWAERDFFLPAKFTSGKTSLVVTVEPLAGGAAWTAAEYRLLCVRE